MIKDEFKTAGKIDRNGIPVIRYAPTVRPEMITAYVEKLLDVR